MVATVVIPSADSLTQSDTVTDASIERYVAAGERVRQLMDLAFKICIGLFVVVALAWAIGVLPAAIKLF